METNVTYTEVELQSGPVVIDNAVQFDYNGVTGFDTGTFSVTYFASTARADDQLGILNEGTGAGQFQKYA